MLKDVAEPRFLIRAELNVKAHDGGQQSFGIVDCVATLDVVAKDFLRGYSLQAHKSKVKTLFRLANGQRETSSTVREIKLYRDRHNFQRGFNVLFDLRVTCTFDVRITMVGRRASFFAIRHDMCLHRDRGNKCGNPNARAPSAVSYEMK
jgi:hypothetical protein